MRILIVIPYYEPAWAYGGPPKVMSMIARQLAAGHQVTVVTTDVCDGEQRLPTGHTTIGGVEVYRFKTLSNTLAWKTKIILPRRLQPQLQQLVAASDVVLLSDFRHWLNAKVAPLLWRLQKPYALAAFGQIDKPHDWKYPLKVWFDWRWGKQLVQRARMLLTQTEHERQQYYSLGARAEQIHLLPLLETAPSSDELAQTGTFRARYQIPTTAKVILFVGRLNKLKGIDLLLQTFAAAKQHLPQQDLRLVIIGRDDGYLAEMNRLIVQLQLTDSVIQTGPLYGVDNAAAYCDADLFLFTPTYFEETSLATVRALSFGLPVITTHQAELPGLDQAQAGYTVESTIPALTDQLTMVLADDILRTQLRTNAQRLFTEQYERNRVIANLEHALKVIC